MGHWGRKKRGKGSKGEEGRKKRKDGNKNWVEQRKGGTIKEKRGKEGKKEDRK